VREIPDELPHSHGIRTPNKKAPSNERVFLMWYPLRPSMRTKLEHSALACPPMRFSGYQLPPSRLKRRIMVTVSPMSYWLGWPDQGA